MPLTSAHVLADNLRDLHLLTSDQMQELGRDLLPRFAEPKALAGELIRRAWLTPYQANLVLQGRGSELLLGSYVLLERIGEGGMGQVFKAQNWKLGRIVALKLIRKERLASDDAIRRFHREIRATAQLAHPNIVAAYDADEVKGTHFFAMELVEGQDLAKLIKQCGPLPIAQACDWMRQAALGLQHAHERGLVHRDIKPHNLLLTKQGVVKLLDMGLAQLGENADDGESSTLTQEGAVMGTLDYIAPEQIGDSHGVDIRADLYSLGCSLYQLLTGKVPFPGGKAIDKLYKHRHEQPTPLEMLRREVPEAVTEVVYRLMAKRPEDRYATPAEAAAALAAVAEIDGRAIAHGARAETAPASVEDTAHVLLDFRPTDAAAQALIAERRSRRQMANRTRLLAAIGGGVLLLVLMGVFRLFLWRSGRQPLAPSSAAVEQPGARQKVLPFDQWLLKAADLPPEAQVKAVIQRLRDHNPSFDAEVKHKINDGIVTELEFVSDDVTDLRPLKALKGLRRLYCMSSSGARGENDNTRAKLVNLSPLRGLSLEHFSCVGTSVSDLGPLRGMPLSWCECGTSPVHDLSPLQGAPLNYLQCGGCLVEDLAPLKGMKTLKILYCRNTSVHDLSPLKGLSLVTLHCSDTAVADLSPLKGMPLEMLVCVNTRVTDLSPLNGMPLKTLSCDFNPKCDTKILRGLRTLEMINRKPATDFWREIDAQP